jgi:hypothetical protein
MACGFIATGRLLASVGSSYDGQLSVWDWAAGTQLARVSAQTELRSVSFTEDGSALVTVGKDHLKVTGAVQLAGSLTATGPAAMVGFGKFWCASHDLTCRPGA